MLLTFLTRNRCSTCSASAPRRRGDDSLESRFNDAS